MGYASQQRYREAQETRRQQTDEVMTDFRQEGFEVFDISVETAQAAMERLARRLTLLQSKDRIEMMISALQKAIS